MSRTMDTLPDPVPTRQPGVAAIALMEAGKAAIALLVALGLVFTGPAPLRTALQRVLQLFGLHADQGSPAQLLAGITPDTIHITSTLLAVYGALRALEAWGLWRTHAWASWLGCISAAIYLPLDLYALFRHPSWVTVGVLAINLLVVWILARDLLQRRKRAA